MDPDLGLAQVGVVFAVGRHGEAVVPSQQCGDRIGDHEVFVAVYIVLQQSVGADDLLTGDLTKREDFLEQKGTVVGDGFHAQLHHLTAAIAEACVAERELMDPFVKGIKDGGQRVHEFPGEHSIVVAHGGHQYRIAFELLGVQQRVRRLDERLEQVGDDLFGVGLGRALHLGADARHVPQVVGADEAGVPADVEQDDEAVNFLHGPFRWMECPIIESRRRLRCQFRAGCRR